MTFAERLQQLRAKAGFTQEELARRSGLSVGAVRNYEQGIREPYWRVVVQMAKALGVSCEVFADATESTPKKSTQKKSKRKSKG